MLTKYLAVLLICTNGECSWVQSKTDHEELWQCLYDIAHLAPEYYENKTVLQVDCILVEKEIIK